jgi:hypothetical protein
MQDVSERQGFVTATTSCTETEKHFILQRNGIFEANTMMKYYVSHETCLCFVQIVLLYCITLCNLMGHKSSHIV